MSLIAEVVFQLLCGDERVGSAVGVAVDQWRNEFIITYITVRITRR
jgi:hypothetical protein